MVIHQTGGPEVFSWEEVPTPEPGPGEVRIKVAWAGVNPADWKNRQGMLAAFRPYTFPCIVGFDAAGTVDALGEGVTGFAPGDRVVTPTNQGQGGPGSYAEYTLASIDKVARVPDGLSLQQAAALPVAALTAWQGVMERGGVKQGDRILIHGGSGGVGSFAVQFAHNAGAEVAATCSTPNVDYVKGLGAAEVIDYREQDIPDALARWAPDGVDLLVDAVGVSTLPNALDLLRPGGCLVRIPTLNDDGDPAAAMAESEQRGLRQVFSTMDDTDCAAALERIMAMIISGDIQMPPLETHPLQQVAEVHRQLEQGHNRGKIVLSVGQHD
jgi:NADPH2:quinone reductase